MPTYASGYIAQAAHWWRAENNPDDRVFALMLFLYQILDALYSDVLAFPPQWAANSTLKMSMGGRTNLIITLPLSPHGLALLRSAIGLVGDAYCICQHLAKLNTANVAEDVEVLLDKVEHLREVRNYFAHLDERIGHPDVHGITGAASTNCGIEYTAASVANTHLVLVGNVLHFSAKDKAAGKAIPFSVDVGRGSFSRVLHASRGIYQKLITHKLHPAKYPPADQLYAI